MRASAVITVLLFAPAIVFGEGQSEPSTSARVHGSLAVQWYHLEDLTDSDLNFSAPTARLKLRADRLWGGDYTIRVRFRSRYDDRARSLSEDVPRTEWRNRLYEMSLSFDDPEAPVNFKLGRIVSNDLAAVGYVDGLLLQHNAGDHWRWGAFAGTRPDWESSDFQTSIQKYGAYVSYLRGDYSSNRFDATLAAAGEYHDSTVSREFLSLRSDYRHGRRWSVYGSLELDVNRDWRKERTGEDISLSGLYVRARWRAADWITAGLGYDNRRNYYTYELRSMADSLFIDAFRHGGRASVDVTLPGDYRLHADFGVRAVESEDDNTYSYAAGISRRNLTAARLSLQLRAAGFSSPYARGLNPSLRVGKSFAGGHSIHVGYGSYLYDVESTDTDRQNQWIRANGQIELPARLYFAGSYEYDWGDDAEGHRLLGEIGYRF